MASSRSRATARGSATGAICKGPLHRLHLPLDDRDSFYLTTDGLIDQIGGLRGRSFGKRRFQELLRQNRGVSMREQEACLRQGLDKYQGEQIRRDDLTVLGFMPHS